MAKFPREIWDGRSPERPTLDSVKPPSYNEWLRLLEELQEMQRYILSLSGNLESMPNIAEEIKDAKTNLDRLSRELRRLAPPADLWQELQEMRELLNAIDSRKDITRLKSGMRRLFMRTKTLINAYKSLKTSVEYQLQVQANDYRNKITALAKEMEERCSSLQDQIQELQDVLQAPDLE